MGLFKRMINYVTGGSAQVDVEINDAQLSRPFKVGVTAEVQIEHLQMEKVYLLFRCTEGKLAGYIEGGKAETDNERILQELNEWDVKTLYKKEVEVTGPSELVSGETYSWEVDVDLSDADSPSVKSEGYEIRWQVQGAIDVPGNDPDSGWVTFEVA